jgi:hypothetical protein
MTAPMDSLSAQSALRPLTSSPSLRQQTDEVLPARCGLDAAALADLRHAGGI